MRAQTINAELSEIIKLLMEAHTYGSKMLLYSQVRKLAQLNQQPLYSITTNTGLMEVQNLDEFMRSTGHNLTSAAKHFGISRWSISRFRGDTECKLHAIVGGVFMKRQKYNPD